MAPSESSRLLITMTRRQATATLVTRLAEEGCAGIRLIAKGYKPAEYRDNFEELEQAARQIREEFRIIVDLPGGKPRISSYTDDFPVERGDQLLLRFDDGGLCEHDGSTSVGTVGLASFITDLHPGHRVLICDGELELRVEQKDEQGFWVEVISEAGMITASRSINLPDSEVLYRSRGDDDGVLVSFEPDSKVEVAVSMAAKATDVERVRAMLPCARVLAKVESQVGLDNLTEIAEHADELVIARGDLSIEVGPRDLMAATERIVDHGRRQGKEVMLAAGMLVSLERGEKPSIAEVSDLWHFHRLGVRQFLLSGTICISQPLEAVRWGRKLLSAWDGTRVAS